MSAIKPFSLSDLQILHDHARMGLGPWDILDIRNDAEDEFHERREQIVEEGRFDTLQRLAALLSEWEQAMYEPHSLTVVIADTVENEHNTEPVREWILTTLAFLRNETRISMECCIAINPVHLAEDDPRLVVNIRELRYCPYGVARDLLHEGLLDRAHVLSSMDA